MGAVRRDWGGGMIALTLTMIGIALAAWVGWIAVCRWAGSDEE